MIKIKINYNNNYGYRNWILVEIVKIVKIVGKLNKGKKGKKKKKREKRKGVKRKGMKGKIINKENSQFYMGLDRKNLKVIFDDMNDNYWIFSILCILDICFNQR